MKALSFVLLVIALHLGVASVAASRHLLMPGSISSLTACDPVR